jgi:rhodanese-related sulfurtransferase
MIRTLAQRHLAEVDRIARTYFHARDQLEPIGRDELLERVRAGEVLVLDVRPPEEYRAGHITGAVSVPVDDLERRLAEIPAHKEVIAYCRGPYCVMALQAVQKLRAHGRAARRLVDGFPEWRAAGLPTETLGEAS